MAQFGNKFFLLKREPKNDIHQWFLYKCVLNSVNTTKPTTPKFLKKCQISIFLKSWLRGLCKYYIVSTFYNIKFINSEIAVKVTLIKDTDSFSYFLEKTLLHFVPFDIPVKVSLLHIALALPCGCHLLLVPKDFEFSFAFNNKISKYTGAWGLGIRIVRIPRPPPPLSDSISEQISSELFVGY